jgi:hypothetical protein
MTGQAHALAGNAGKSFTQVSFGLAQTSVTKRFVGC